MSGEEDWIILDRLRKEYPEFTGNGTCIDGGSRNMNGSVTYFLGPDVKYIGIDKCGDVDEVQKDISVAGVSWHGYIHDYPGKEVADLVTSFNTFEHDPYWKKSVTHLIELLKPGGLFIFQLVLSGPEHGDSYSVNGHYENMGYQSFTAHLTTLPITILEDVKRIAGSESVCPVDRMGEQRTNGPTLSYCARDFTYLIGRKNGQ